MAPLQFFFQEFVDEIIAIEALARPFIPGNSVHALPQLRSTLEGIRTAATGRPYNWGIPESSPLRTIVSEGQYEAGGRRGSEHIFASLSSGWEINPLGPHNRASLPHRKFELVGQASTRVRIFRNSPVGKHQEIAMWRMEIADDASPGCYFHAQILAQSKKIPFPRSLPVPRFPIFLASPPAVLEFVLSEIFQNEWRMEVLRDSTALQRWRPIQLRRFSNLLKWQRDEVHKLPGSPWVVIKRLQPQTDLFLSDLL